MHHFNCIENEKLAACRKPYQDQELAFKYLHTSTLKYKYIKVFAISELRLAGMSRNTFHQQVWLSI